MQVLQNRVPAHFHQIHFRKVAQTIVVTAALMAITRFTIEHAQKRTKRPITPFKGNQRATLAYSAVSVAYLASSLAVLDPFAKQPRIVPFQPAQENREEEVDLLHPLREGEGQEVAIVPSERVPAQQVLNAVRLSREAIWAALQDRNLHRLQQNIFLGGQHVIIDLDLGDRMAVEQCLEAHNALEQRLQLPVQRRRALEMVPPQSEVRILQQRAITSLSSRHAMSFPFPAIENVQESTKPIASLKGNQRVTLAYSAASVASFAASMTAMTPFTEQPGQSLRIVPFRPAEIVDSSQPHSRKKGQEVAIIPERQVLDAVMLSREALLRALQDKNLHWLQQDIFLGGQHVTIDLDLRNPRAVRQCLGALNALERRLQLPVQRRKALEMVPSQTRVLPAQQRAIMLLPEHRLLFLQREAQVRFGHQLNRGPLDDRLLPSLSESLRLPGRRELVSPELFRSIFESPEERPLDDFILVSRPCLPEIGVSNEHLFGQNGVLMRLMLFRNLLDEYNHLLKGEGIDLTNAHESQELRLVLYYLTNLESASDAKEQYERFVDAHEALILAEKSKEVAHICRVVARVRMTPRIQSFQNDFVQQHINPHDRLTLQNFSRIFVERNKAIAASDLLMRVDKRACDWIKLYGAMSWAHYMKINPPQLRNIEDGVYYLRHSTPNKYDSVKGVIIDPLYQEFLRGADGLVLYAAHQRLQDDGFPENEDVRCQTLIKLEQEEKNLMLLFQSVENTLFKKGARTFEDLKARLIDSFYQTEGHRLNRLPLRLKDREGYREKMEEICDFIHLRFFGNRLNVNQDRVDLYGGLAEEKKTTEWQTFIMLFYYYQREGLKADYPIKYVNTGCKDDFDRGGAQNLLTDLMHLIEKYGTRIPPRRLEEISERLEEIISSIQAPTLQLKGTEPIKYRIHPALCVVQLLLSLREDDIRAIQARGRVKNVVTERREQQPAIFLPKLARTLAEYKAILTSLSGRSYTVHSAQMIEDNYTMLRDRIASQLERNYANGLTVDGYLYNGAVGWGWNAYPYTIKQIYKELTETHQLSEDAAVRIMNQLEVQIYSQPFLELKKNLEIGDLMLRGVPGKHSPISLTTEGEEFVVNGQTQYEIVDMSKDGARVASLDVNVTLRIPKTEGQRESGAWSWRVNQIS